VESAPNRREIASEADRNLLIREVDEKEIRLFLICQARIGHRRQARPVDCVQY
jgi:hypothetical protein